MTVLLNPSFRRGCWFLLFVCPGNQPAYRREPFPGVQSTLWNNAHHWLCKDTWVKDTNFDLGGEGSKKKKYVPFSQPTPGLNS